MLRWPVNYANQTAMVLLMMTRLCTVAMFSFGGFSGLGFYVKYTHRVHSQVELTCPKG